MCERVRDCICVCVWENRKERKKERERQKESDMGGDRIKYDEWKSLFGVS